MSAAELSRHLRLHMGNESGKKSKRLVSVDVLRGVAVLAVVVCHLPFSGRGLSGETTGADIFPALWIAEILEYGALGVQLFLVISGFCIHLRWARDADPHQSIPFIPFWKRRLFRLYPPYFVALLGALAGTFLLNTVLLDAGGSLGGMFGYASTTTFVVDVFLLFFMLQNLTPAPWRVGNGPFWSLALEEQLYLMYFPMLALRRRAGWKWTLILTALATVTWRVLGQFLFVKPPFFWYLVGPAFWFPWTLGALAVEAYFGHVRLPSWTRSIPLAVLMFAGGVTASWIPVEPLGTIAGSLDDLLYCGSFFIVLTAMTRHEKANPGVSRFSSILSRVGIWSYSIYLIHMLAMVPVKRLAVELGIPDPAILVLRLSAGVVGGYLFFRLIELPVHRQSRKIPVDA